MDYDAAACKPDRLGVSASEAVNKFFPTRQEGADNHASEAIKICAGCPIREDCLFEAVTLRITDGIWGGAGTSTRRALRRAWREGNYREASDAHFRSLDGDTLSTDDRSLLAAYGPGATHASRETYARGCRCDPCAASASLYSVSQTIGVNL